MDINVIIVLTICILTIIGFVTEVIRTDLLAILVAILLVIFGIIPSEDVLKGLSNPATLTVLAMFILSEGVFKTGIINKLGLKIYNLSNDSLKRATIIIMIFVGVVSMFINNTAAVALMIPMVMDISKRGNWSPSKLLIPLSFASMFGGVCTLIGTSTNLLANSFLIEKGYEPFSMFSFTSEGLIFFFSGIVFLMFLGGYLIPSRREAKDLTKVFDLAKYLIEVKVKKNNDLIGKNVEERDLNSKFEIINIVNRKGNIVKEGDVLRIRIDFEGIKEIFSTDLFEIITRKNISDEDLDTANQILVEAVIGPRSKLIGKQLARLKRYQYFASKVLAIRHHQHIEHESPLRKKLEAGDSLLLSIKKENISRLEDSGLFTLFYEKNSDTFNPKKTSLALSIFLGMIAATKLALLPIHISAILSACLFILFKIIDFDEAYEAVDWKIIFLLAGLLSLGSAMDSSGTTAWIGTQLKTYLQGQNSAVIVGTFFSITMILTAFMSNNASVALMAPLAIYSAETLGIDVHNLVLTVMFASSMSFMTPIGYQTNMMIYSVGNFKFSDFVKVGVPLCVLFVILAIFVFS